LEDSRSKNNGGVGGGVNAATVTANTIIANNDTPTVTIPLRRGHKVQEEGTGIQSIAYLLNY
jgi:hypothetical protein